MDYFDCKCCKEIKPINSFSVVSHNQNKRGVDSWCKSCKKLATKRYRKNNPDKAAKWKRESKVRSYGISVETYQKMISDQNNCCAICGTSSDRSLDIDHCHTTGKVRGLLCSYCNKAIGMFKDNAEYLKSAIKYLKLNEGVK